MATILLAVTGSIAAYKAADLASKLTQNGHDVTVLMTAAAGRLVDPNTFLNLTGNRVYSDLWDPEVQTRHIALTDAAELVVLAPATANTLAKLAHGLADDAVSTTLLAVDCPLLVCPAMNPRMWRNPLVQRNLAQVRALGATVLLPDEGRMACGHTGPGRMPEPERILAAIEALLAGEPVREAKGEEAAAGGGALFLEMLVTEEAPDEALLAEERRYRGEAVAAGGQVAFGRLARNRFAALHRAPALDDALAAAKASPLGRGRCSIHVFPWTLDAGALPF